AYRQKILAQVKSGSCRRAASQMVGCWISLRDRIQKRTSPVSRKYHPFPTTPCLLVIVSVRLVSCIEQVTAGCTERTDARVPLDNQSDNNAARSTMQSGVSPTPLMTAVLFMAIRLSVGKQWS